MDTSSNQLQASSPESPPNSSCFPFPKGKQKRKAGRKKFQETRHPVYNGVRRRNGKWVCELRQPHTKSRIWLGTFSCPQMAARAHDVAALALKGESAPLNFPETVHLLPRAKSSSIKDIQIAALEAAEDHSNINNTGGISSFNHAEEKTRVGEETSNRKMFLDEEELFNMPALLDAMAEGLILTPPALKRGFSWDGYIENDTAMDLTLWSD